MLVLPAQDAGPGDVHAAPLQQRRPVQGAVLFVQLVGELVKDHVMPVADIGGAGSDVVPGQDDGAVPPRLAQPGCRAIAHDAVSRLLPALRHVGSRVDEHGPDPGEAVRIAMQQQQAGLGGNGEPDLVGDLQSAAALEVHPHQECPDEALELLEVLPQQAAAEGHVAPDGLRPIDRKGHPPGAPEPEPSQQAAHRPAPRRE